MKSSEIKRSRWLAGLALFAVFFGTLTVISGGSVLFSAAGRQAAGNVVGFVLWFNFLAGFTYIAAGVGLWRLQRWAVGLSAAIATATLIVFAAFGVQVATGAAFEFRTVAAMILRAGVWVIISAVAYKNLMPTSPHPKS